ncbi:hypothetical protein [Microbacterium sp. NPDC089696]|uniref:hypothetical protein n=1 Tax=Microbacterium sp. NPDC089696 TaxID=3364199 RepID=UPI0037F9E47C
MNARPRSRATDRIGDVVGVSAAVVGTIALHLFLFGGDRYFALRFLVFPVDNPIAFAAFLVTVVLLVIAIVRASRARAWGVLRGAGQGSEQAPAVSQAEQPAVERPLAAVAVPGAVTRRALRAAAIVAVLNALFMIVFPIAVIPMFAVIFLIAAALIAAVYIVLRAVGPGASSL